MHPYLLILGRGVGQVMFQPSPITGLLFFAAVLVNSRISAFYMVLGVGLPLVLLAANEMNYSNFNAGLYAYNAVLCAIALGERTRAGLCWAIMAIVLSVVLQWFGMHAGLVTLTAPFVLATWAVQAVRRFSGYGVRSLLEKFFELRSGKGP